MLKAISQAGDTGLKRSVFFSHLFMHKREKEEEEKKREKDKAAMSTALLCRPYDRSHTMSMIWTQPSLGKEEEQ